MSAVLGYAAECQQQHQAEWQLPYPEAHMRRVVRGMQVRHGRRCGARIVFPDCHRLAPVRISLDYLRAVVPHLPFTVQFAARR